MKKITCIISLAVVLIISSVIGCADPTDGMGGGSANITREAVEYYLAEEQLNSPGVAIAVTTAVNNGEIYKELIKDERNKGTTLRAWIDSQDQEKFCITYYRDMVCPKCKGTGIMALPTKIQDAIQSKVKSTNIAITCNQCHGTGYLKKQLQKKCWILGVADYKDPQAAIAREEANSLQTAPPDTQQYIDQLASTDPRTRLDACIWLNDNYIRPGMPLTEIIPILDRARFVSPIKDNSLLRKIMGKATGQHEYTVYQFWAGKGSTELHNQAYYRIYVDSSAGEVLRTSFASEQSVNQRKR